MVLSHSVSVDGDAWQDWLYAVGNTETIRSVELPADLLCGTPEVQDALAEYALSVRHVRDVIPPDVGRYLFESPDTTREEITREAISALTALADMGIESASLQLGLDRIPPEFLDTEIERRTVFIRRLLNAVDGAVTLAFVLRCPRDFPSSKAWEYAGNLLHEVMHAKCRFRVDAYPSQISPDFDVADFVRSFYLHAGVVRLNWAPSVGEDLDGIEATTWTNALARHGFRGELVFSPSGLTELDRIRRACAEIDGFSARLARS